MDTMAATAEEETAVEEEAATVEEEVATVEEAAATAAEEEATKLPSQRRTWRRIAVRYTSITIICGYYALYQQDVSNYFIAEHKGVIIIIDGCNLTLKVG